MKAVRGVFSNGRGRRTLTLAAALLLSDRPFALAQSVAAPPEGPAAATANERRTLRRLPANLGRGLVGVFHRETLLPLVIGGVATGGADVLDEAVREHINPNPGEGWGQTLETGAGPVWSGVFVAGLFGAGRISQNTRFRNTTYDLLEGAVVNGLYTQALKVAVKRERPNGSNDQSFPSGHTSNAFVLATVAERHYGRKVGIPAYVLAGLVGASRLKQDMHFFSDVVAGATVGYIVGRAVVRMNNRPLDGASRGAAVNIAPIMARRARGVQVSVIF